MISPLDGSGPEEVEIKSLKREGKKEKKKAKTKRKRPFKNGLVLISLSEEKRGFRQSRKKSYIEHCLASKTAVQNTIKIKFILPEKASYLAIATDVWCNV